MREALWSELLKARRSRLPALTALAFTLVTLVCGLFMFILADPARARALGLLGDKAQLSGAVADWPGYLTLLAQAVAVGGLLVYSMIVIWVFGREYSDHTAKDLLALPTSRTTIVAAKFTLAAAWALLLAAGTTVGGLLLGALPALPDWSAQAVAAGVMRILVAAALAAALTTPLALAAGIGRGYLAAVGVRSSWPSPPRSSPRSASAPGSPTRYPACTRASPGPATTRPDRSASCSSWSPAQSAWRQPSRGGATPTTTADSN